MLERLVNFFIGIFGGLTALAFGKELIVFVISLLPILELRGGLIAASLMNMNPITSYIICFIANLIPIPIILWLVVPVLNKLKNFKKLVNFIDKLEEKALKKQDRIEKYEFWGLALFVAIPLPGTGVWTGCLVAALMGMDKRKATISAILGVLVASIIMMIISFGILNNIIG